MKNGLSKEDQRKIDNISLDNFDFLNKAIYSERELLRISQLLMQEGEESRRTIVSNLIDRIASYDKKYDWNIASILQHLPTDLVIGIFKEVKNTPRLYNSIGLAWLFGEFNRKDQFVVDFLYAVVNYSTIQTLGGERLFHLKILALRKQ